MTIRKTLNAVGAILKKALVAVGNGSDAIWSHPLAGATQPATQKGTSDQNIDSIWGTPADIETMWDSPGSAKSAVTQQGGAGIPPALQAPQSTETPLGVTPQKKNVRGKEPTLEDILPVPPGW